jgi:hypothetical protein
MERVGRMGASLPEGKWRGWEEGVLDSNGEGREKDT